MTAPESPLILVGWDGADWKIARPLIAAGKLPQLAEIVARGASGNLASFAPFLSPMLWNTIATGRRPDEHGITGFAAVDPATQRVRPVSSRNRRCKALWNILSQENLHAHVVGWFASHPAEPINGVCISEAFARPPDRSAAADAPWPIPKNSIAPAKIADEFAGCRVKPSDLDPGLAAFFVPRWREIDREKDHRLDRLALRLAELYSVHNAAIAIAESEPVDFLAVYYHFIDWICHDFMAYRAPRRPEISEFDCAVYGQVVDAAYVLQDRLLTDLLQRFAPRNPTVLLVSDHGFHSDHLRPARTPRVSAGIAAWHRSHGLLAAAGPTIASNRDLAEARLLDIAPTILAHFGLPAGEDMEGRVLTRLFRQPPPTRRITSWETHPATSNGSPIVDPTWTGDDEADLLRQFEALGYIDNSGDPTTAAERTRRDNAFNLGVALLHLGRPALALPHLEEAWFLAPESAHLSRQLAHCQLQLGLADEAGHTIEALLDLGPAHPAARFALAEIALRRDDPAAALLHLQAASRDEVSSPPSHLLLRGLALAQLERHLEAAVILDEAARLDPDNAETALALARLAASQRNWHDAARHARRAVALRYDFAAAHFIHGAALQHLGQLHEASASLALALRFDPANLDARLRLAQINSALRVDPARNEELLHAFAGRPPHVPLDWSTLTAEERESLHWLKPVDLAALRTASRERLARWSAERRAARARTSPIDCIRPAPTPGSSGRTLVIVSGLPRSGTSLMMQMLAAGGLPPKTDGRRPASPDNPRGFFEWEAIKRLPREPALLDSVGREAVKVVSPLLPYLPSAHRYRIIFMRRPVAEIAASQAAMLRRENPAATILPDAAEKLREHCDRMLEQLRQHPACDLLELDYASILACPADAVNSLSAFLGSEFLPHPERMATAVDPSLHRQRVS